MSRYAAADYTKVETGPELPGKRKLKRVDSIRTEHMTFATYLRRGGAAADSDYSTATACTAAPGDTGVTPHLPIYTEPIWTLINGRNNQHLHGNSY
jgi:hypothetical protein